VATAEIQTYSWDERECGLCKTELQIAELTRNIGHVHYELCLLEASGRFSEEASAKNPTPDVSSCLFHLCEASNHGHKYAALALGRLRHGLCTAAIPEIAAGLGYVTADLDSARLMYEVSSVRGSIAGSYWAGELNRQCGGEIFLKCCTNTIVTLINSCIMRRGKEGHSVPESSRALASH
jgi:hypothetical protein